MNETFFITTEAVVSAVCWLIIAAGATAAVLSPRINDTLLERVALAAVAIGSVATAWRIGDQGWISEGASFISMALAGYVLVVVHKNFKRGRVWPLSKR